MHEDILKFISKFKKATDCFLDGCCYWFAHILNHRFGGVIFYDMIVGHFFLVQGGRCYDVRGDITNAYGELIREINFENAMTLKTKVVPWSVYQVVEPIAASRIEADSIQLVDREV